MGIFDYLKQTSEHNVVKIQMESVGAYKSDTRNCCEKCNNYVSASQIGGSYGGCIAHGVRVFSTYICSQFSR